MIAEPLYYVPISLLFFALLFPFCFFVSVSVPAWSFPVESILPARISDGAFSDTLWISPPLSSVSKYRIKVISESPRDFHVKVENLALAAGNREREELIDTALGESARDKVPKHSHAKKRILRAVRINLSRGGLRKLHLEDRVIRSRVDPDREINAFDDRCRRDRDRRDS